ncbi:non-classical export protein Nce102, putative [Cordyceps militaris CM01]|uniref:Non-classical export protein Nce102, putative n=2 Tax=Cordyceps militaris TaxID=73501 RepID=G3J7B8_CORMM|nr:non-classical export protein Nce102, putative [Cordyceps militaris CM01]ATY62680.1 MARVEL-like domain [Cordyceps militaris]EGX96288.1 non-classical export protein Nce102, putative [Cordyceps militaris CM01]
MSGFFNLILRVLALLFTIIITGLIGNVIAQDRNASMSASAAVNFTMFVAALSWVVCLYGMVATVISSLGKPILLTVLDGLGVLFTLISAIVLAAKIGRTNCSSTVDRPTNWIAYGSGNPEHRCRELQASDVFMWFLWLTLCGGLFFSLTEMRSPMGAARSSRPAMSQV